MPEMTENRLSRGISYALSGGLLIVLVLLALFDPPFINRPHLMDALFFFLLGTVFMLAYFFESALVLFRVIVWIGEKLSFPSGRYMTIVFGCLFFVASGFQLSNAVR
jgi:hypothetical protein